MTKIWISTGLSRKEMNWKNIEVSWDNFCEKLKTPVRTNETFKEYLGMSKDDQGIVKDVGGFVGGIIQGGRRGINSVTSRSILTLDVDFGTTNFWGDFQMLFGCEAILYTTHKHCSESPRYRLIIPLGREVLPDEHEAIARRVAGDLNINLFDPTTFQTERLMYWPSASKDGEYECVRQKGPWLDPDEVLAQYWDWRDMTQWPIADKAAKKVVKEADKQAEPTEKEGLVGTFCRIYGIKAAIEKFLTEVYEETTYEDRYTFKAGSTSAGVIVHDDKFSLSFHSTDPTCGRLCNAFDLVRIHLFGDSDDRVDPKTPHTKRPSYGKMIELCSQDAEVKKLMLAEKMEDMQMLGFIGEDQALKVEDLDWAENLETDRKGQALQTIRNVILILENDPRIKNNMYWNDFSKFAMLKRDLPWRKIGEFTDYLIDADDPSFREFFETNYGITNKDKINDAINIVLHKNSMHPIKNFFKTLKWDGKKRVEEFFVKWLGAEDSSYVRTVTKKLLVAAVARVYQPGIKFDNLIVLTGPQGLGKSRLVSMLAVQKDWHSDTLGNVQTKEGLESIQGAWIMEIGELKGMKGKEIEAVKHFVAKPVDKFRITWGKRTQFYPRQVIFIGTTNDEQFLVDITGNRRFWPIRCWKKMGRGPDKEEVEQLWAEALELYVMGEDLHLDDEMELEAEKMQEQYMEVDDRIGKIEEFLSRKIPGNWRDLGIYDRRAFLDGETNESVYGDEKTWVERDFVTVPEIWIELFKGTDKDMTQYNVKFIRGIMNKRKDWTGKLFNHKPYGTQRGWERVRTAKAAKLETR